MKFNKEFFRNLILYGIIGALSSGLDMLVFSLLFKRFGINEFVSNTISVHCGIFLSFFLNSRYNFKKTDNFWGRFIPFYLMAAKGRRSPQSALVIVNYRTKRGAFPPPAHIFMRF